MHVHVCVCVREKRLKSKKNLIIKQLKYYSKQLHVSVATTLCTLEDFSISPLILIALLCCSRWNDERHPGSVLRLLHHHLLSSGHHLHIAGGALLCGLHRCDPAHPHLCQPGA